MARINIEECWWTDPRRDRLAKLCGSLDSADGLIIRTWRLAQEFWGRGKHLIPLEIFESIEANANLIEAKLAEVRGNEVYVKGSAQYLDWVNERRKAAASGGKKSGQTRRAKFKDAESQSSTYVKQNEAKPTKRNQTQPSGSDSGSDSGSLNTQLSSTIGKTQGVVAASSEVTSIKPQEWNPIGMWLTLWGKKYGGRYPLQGKDNGSLTNMKKNFNRDQVATLFAAYLAIEKPLYAEGRHPLSLFFRDLPMVSQAAQSGINPLEDEKARKHNRLLERLK